MKRLRLPIFVLLAWVAPAQGQGVGTCDPGLGEGILEGRDVRVRIPNNGMLAWRGDPYVYEVPKGSGEGPLFVGSLLIGGMVEDSVRVAGTTYGPYEFWPGPLGPGGTAPVDCAPYDRVWRVSREAIETYDRQDAGDVEDWPVHLGAPVLDGDGVPDNYDFAGGDRPAILGDEAVWWVMNDRGGEHERTRSLPIGLEVRAMAFAFDMPGMLGKATFYRYRITYHGDAPLDSAYVGLFLDPDLGNFDDDFVGSDSTLHLGYVYNSDDDDDGHYGVAPPAFGVTVLQGPRGLPNGRDDDGDGDVDEPGERVGMAAFSTYFGGADVQGDPWTGEDFYNYFQGRWRDAQPFTVGGSGRGFSDTPTRFAYSGDPVTGGFWSEMNIDGRGTANQPADRRFIASTGPFSMQLGETEEVVFALIWSRGEDHLDSIRRLRGDVARVHAAREELLVPRIEAVRVPPPRVPLSFAPPSPNPVRTATRLRYSLPRTAHVRLAVYDAVGREVEVLVAATQGEGSHEATLAADRLLAGVYFVRLVIDGTPFVHPFVVVH